MSEHGQSNTIIAMPIVDDRWPPVPSCKLMESSEFISIRDCCGVYVKYKQIDKLRIRYRGYNSVLLYFYIMFNYLPVSIH